MTKAEREARKAWLAALKAGDEVVSERTDHGAECSCIVSVKLRTDNGIWVDYGGSSWRRFLPSNGRVENRVFHGPLWIVPVTDARRTHARADEIRNRLGRWTPWDWSKLSDDTVLAIRKLLDVEARKKVEEAK
jgi:hypothetical protein